MHIDIASARAASSAPVSRAGLLAVLLGIGFASAITDRIIMSGQDGWISAILSTFNVSAIVWGACWYALTLASSARDEKARVADFVAAALASATFLAPFSLLTWVGLTALALYTALTTPRGTGLWRGAWLFFAVTIPCFWSPRFFSLFSDSVLSVDAALVSHIVGTERVGNTVPLANGGGFLYIAPGCSSLANVSLAVLCWACFAHLSDRRISLRDVAWGLLACVAVVVVNVVRISLVGYFPEYYELLHGATGYTVAGYATLVVTVAICAYWRRRELFGDSQGGAGPRRDSERSEQDLLLRAE